MTRSIFAHDRCSGRRSITMVVALVLAVASVCCATAFAASYDYCVGCTIPGNSGVRDSSVSKYSSLSYVHRLSGPPAYTMSIGAGAYIAGGGFVCANINTVLEITCNPGGNYVRGRAQNFGSGNYGFNAHLNY